MTLDPFFDRGTQGSYFIDAEDPSGQASTVARGVTREPKTGARFNACPYSTAFSPYCDSASHANRMHPQHAL